MHMLPTSSTLVSVAKSRTILSHQRLSSLCGKWHPSFTKGVHRWASGLLPNACSPQSIRLSTHVPTTQVRRFSIERIRSIWNKKKIPSSSRCETCSQLDLRKIFREGVEHSTSSSGSTAQGEVDGAAGETSKGMQEDDLIHLGFLDEIAKRPDCPFCRLVVHLVRLSYPNLVGPDSLSNIENPDRVACGLRTIEAHELDDFRRQDDAGPSAIYLDVVLRANGQRLPPRRYLVLDAEDAAPRKMLRYPDEPPRPCFYSGRSISPERVDFNLLKDWLKTCENSHSYPRCSYKSTANPSDLPELRVIDVHSRTVIDAPPACRYATLSYVWGPSSVAKNTFRLKRADCASQINRSIKLPSHLPKTIEDAMLVVQEVGERYLWVDALCIFDDDLQDKQSQISHMADIYGQSSFTIVAAHGEDADAGLPGVRQRSRIGEPQFSEVVDGLRIYVSLPSLGDELYGNEEALDEEEDEAQPAEDFPMIVKASVPPGWISRAWTMQEGLLSARCLIFTRSQAFWVCSAELCCESIAEPPKSQRFWLKPSSWTISAFSSPLIAPPGEVLEVSGSRGSHQFNTYSDLVHKYSKRQLTFQHDKLNAIDGIIKALSYRFGTEVFFGMPEDFFDLTLLWRVSTFCPGFLRNADYPSWSWASWHGEVSYEREIDLHFLTQDDYAKPMNEYFKETWEKRKEPILQLVDDDDTEPSMSALLNSHSSRTFSPFLYFEASSAKFKIFSVTGGPWCRILTDPPCHVDPQPDVGVDVYIDNPLDIERLHGIDCEFIVLSKWFDEGAIEYQIWEEYRSAVYNVMCIEWRDGIAYRLGVGSIKTEIWEKAGPIRKAIKLG